MALLQFNDPDPLYWVWVYGGTAVVAVAKCLGRSSPFWNVLLLGAALSGMVIALPSLLEYLRDGDWASIAGSMESNAHAEPVREFLGLLLAAALLCWYQRR